MSHIGCTTPKPKPSCMSSREPQGKSITELSVANSWSHLNLEIESHRPCLNPSASLSYFLRHPPEAPDMPPKSPLLLFFFLFLPLVARTSVPPPDLAPTSPDENATEFIRARCVLTRYPDLCFMSLSSYASAVRRSPVQLARLATNVTHARLRALRAHVSALRRAGAGGPGREAAALRDCVEQLGDAADQVGRTAAELRGLEALVGMEVAWRVSNAQTWMSAALTNEDTCSDGFREVGGGGGTSSIRTDVCRRVGRVKQYTSNALALVNSLVNGG
ncbi:hypothetical protein BHM03_00007980 [Ensete ventricosum]|nr:hypothetical protein BHM03_00007980 [Ensete ventricosum]